MEGKRDELKTGESERTHYGSLAITQNLLKFDWRGFGEVNWIERGSEEENM